MQRWAARQVLKMKSRARGAHFSKTARSAAPPVEMDSKEQAKEFILSGETLATRPRKGEDFIPGSGGVASQVLAFVVPALRKVREGRGTHSLSGGNEGQKPGPAAGLITGYSRR